MRYIFVSILSILLVANSQAQVEKYYKLVITFKDKNNSGYSLTKPEQFLSERALERRKKHGIKPDEYDLPVTPAYIQGVCNLGAVLVNKLNWSNRIQVSTKDSLFATKVTGLPYVSDVKLVYTGFRQVKRQIPVSAKLLKNDSTFQWQNQEYGNALNQVHMIGADYLHSRGWTGKNIIIAVLDGGFYKVNELPLFDYIRSANRILGTWDFVANESSVYEDNSHGMYVLSAIAGYAPGKIAGTAPDASFYLLRTEDAASETISEEYNWEAGALYADSAGADIISSSLGYTTFDNGIGSHTYADMNGHTTVVTRAADFAASRGILVVNSAGNSGNDPWFYIGAPADGDSVLAIGAVDMNESIAGFSSRGPTYDKRIKPDVCARGVQTVLSSTSGGISQSNGTSFSCPLVAGAAASLMSANPQAGWYDIFHAIRKSADRYENPDNSYGYGIPNMGYAHLILQNKSAPDIYKQQKISVYPNPVTGQILSTDFFSQDSGWIDVEITDINGKIIYTRREQVNKHSLNRIEIRPAAPLSPGAYILLLRDTSKKFSTKFLVP
jgi:hypothetical protein